MSRAAPGGVLLIAEDGAGAAHLLRALALARRVETRACALLSFSPATPLLGALGAHAEFFPGREPSNFDSADWNAWLAAKIDHMFRAFAVDRLAYVGATPPRGVVDALAGRHAPRSFWVRGARGAAGAGARAMDMLFDAIIEDGDEAGSRKADDAVAICRVPPIALFERAELFTRQDAADRLGVATPRRRLLVDLGALGDGAAQQARRAIQAATADIADLAGYELADPLTIGLPMAPTPFRPLAAFPAAQFYRAFDAAILAADEGAAHGAGIAGLPALIVADAVGLEGKVRAFLRPTALKARAARLKAERPKNGARAAAKVIAADA